jgi:hypothetical protein
VLVQPDCFWLLLPLVAGEHSLIWYGDNPHPALGTLRGYLAATRSSLPGAGTWTPAWARRNGG